MESGVSSVGGTNIQSQGHDTSNFYPQSDSILQVRIMTAAWLACVSSTYVCICVMLHVLCVCIISGASDSAPGCHSSHPNPTAAADTTAVTGSILTPTTNRPQQNSLFYLDPRSSCSRRNNFGPPTTALTTAGPAATTSHHISFDSTTC